MNTIHKIVHKRGENERILNILSENDQESSDTQPYKRGLHEIYIDQINSNVQNVITLRKTDKLPAGKEEERHWDTREPLHEKVCSQTGLYVKNRILSSQGIEDTRDQLEAGSVEIIRMGGDEFNLLWKDPETGTFLNYVIDFRNMAAVNNVGRSEAVNAYLQEIPDAIQEAFKAPENQTTIEKLEAIDLVLKTLRDKHLPPNDEKIIEAGRYARQRSIMRGLRQEGYGLAPEAFEAFLIEKLETNDWITPQTFRGRDISQLSVYLRAAILQDWYAKKTIQEEIKSGAQGTESVMDPAGILMEMDMTSEGIIAANEEAGILLGKIKRGETGINPFESHQVKESHLPETAKEEIKTFRNREERHKVVFEQFIQICQDLRKEENLLNPDFEKIQQLQAQKADLRSQEREIRASDASLDGALRLNLCAHYTAGETFRLPGSQEKPQSREFQMVRLDKEGYSGYNNGIDHLFGDEIMNNILFGLAKKHLGSRKFIRDTGGSLCFLIPKRHYEAFQTRLTIFHSEAVYLMEQLMEELPKRGQGTRGIETTKEMAESIILKLDTTEAKERASRQGRSWDNFAPNMIDIKTTPVTIKTNQTLGEVFGAR